MASNRFGLNCILGLWVALNCLGCTQNLGQASPVSSPSPEPSATSLDATPHQAIFPVSGVDYVTGVFPDGAIKLAATVYPPESPRGNRYAIQLVAEVSGMEIYLSANGTEHLQGGVSTGDNSYSIEIPNIHPGKYKIYSKPDTKLLGEYEVVSGPVNK